MLSCDYNGWADVPEAEREAIDAFEAMSQLPLVPPVLRASWPRPDVPLRVVPQRRAA
jgi:hypothetical protein